MFSLYSGLDVHKDSVVVATAAIDGSQPTSYGSWGGSNLSVERGLNKLRKSFELDKSQLSICYEAGPSGFVLARRLLSLGYHCIVVAPSLIPAIPGQKVKTDKRDATKLAGLLRAHQLKAVHIPDPKDEAIRDVSRGRTDAVEALARLKQQLGMFLLRNGVRYKGTTTWTHSHMNYLRKLKMADPVQQILLEEYIMHIELGVQRVNRLEEHMHELLKTWERKPYVDALMAFRGFQVVAAMTQVSELGDLSRFSNPRELMSYIGLVPSEKSSGPKRRVGSITKSGNAHARWMLVECASHYAHPAKVSPQLSMRQKGQSYQVCCISWKAQTRLNSRYKRLMARGLNRNKVIVALARELCGFLWELHLQVAQELSSQYQN